MSLADTRMNNVMKKLTSWAAIIAVPTAVTGYYGQNVPYPGFGARVGFLGQRRADAGDRADALRLLQAQATGSDHLGPPPQPARLGSVPVNRPAAASRSSGTGP